MGKHREVNTERICNLLADTLNTSGKRARQSTARTGEVDTVQWQKYLAEKGLAGRIARKFGFQNRLKQRGDTVYCVRQGEGHESAYKRTVSRLAHLARRKR